MSAAVAQTKNSLSGAVCLPSCKQPRGNPIRIGGALLHNKLQQAAGTGHATSIVHGAGGRGKGQAGETIGRQLACCRCVARRVASGMANGWRQLPQTQRNNKHTKIM